MHPISLIGIADDTWNHRTAPIAVQLTRYCIHLGRLREIIYAEDFGNFSPQCFLVDIRNQNVKFVRVYVADIAKFVNVNIPAGVSSLLPALHGVMVQWSWI